MALGLSRSRFLKAMAGLPAFGAVAPGRVVPQAQHVGIRQESRQAIQDALRASGGFDPLADQEACHAVRRIDRRGRARVMLRCGRARARPWR